MSEHFIYARGCWVEANYCADGQRFTELMREVLVEYVERLGCSRASISINGTSFIKDGGVDGWIDCELLNDPLTYLAPKCVFQFKSSDTRIATMREELEKVPAEGSRRIRDFIKDGFKVVWFVADTKSDPDVQRMEAELIDSVRSINQEAPRPILIDTNRLCDFLSRIPATALARQGLPAVANTLDRILAAPPHSDLPFVPPNEFDNFCNEIAQFVRGNDGLKIFQGDPGIGKTRRILEALKTNPDLAPFAIYLPSQQDFGRVLTLFREHGLRGILVVDDYIENDARLTRIRQDEVPTGCKIVLIQHAFETERKRGMKSFYDIPPLTNDELSRVLDFYEEDRGVPRNLRRQAVALSRHNVRLAKWICMNVDPFGTLTQNDFDSLVNDELDRVDDGLGIVQRLALVRFLPIDRLEEFCSLIQREPTEFREHCRRIAQRSGFIQFNDTLMYVSIPLISQLALIRFWQQEKSHCERIFADPRGFADELIARANGLATGAAKDALLRFFRLPSGPLTIDRLDSEPGYGRLLLTLLQSQPSKYLSLLYEALKVQRNSFSQWRYESVRGTGRRDFIWILRSLAQFSEHFLLCEEIVYWMARNEVTSPYSNVASSYWPTWFSAWLSNTEFPLEGRLDLLEQRVRFGDELDKRFAVSALANVFPQVRSDLPQERVGGRIAASREQQYIQDDIWTTIDRVPKLFKLLLDSGEPIASLAASAWIENIFSWLEVTGDPEVVSSVISYKAFPLDKRRDAYVKVSHYVRISKEDNRDERLARLHTLHRELIALLGEPDDVLTDAKLVLGEGSWLVSDDPELSSKRDALIEAVATNNSVLDTLRPLLDGPDQWSASQFGESVAKLADLSLLWSELVRAKEDPPVPFLLGLIGGFYARFPKIGDDLICWAEKHEESRPRTALALYRQISQEKYAYLAAKLVRSGTLSPRFFSSAWTFVDFESPVGIDLLNAFDEKVLSGDDAAIGTVLALADGLKRKGKVGPKLAETIFEAFLRYEVSSHENGGSTWTSVGLNLLKIKPVEVVEHVSQFSMHGASGPLRIILEAVKEHPELVLNALTGRLSEAWGDHALFAGDLRSVFNEVSEIEFNGWMRRLSNDQAVGLARHLPRPYLADGKAIVPLNTRAYWKLHPPGSEGYEEAMSEFRANTFSTGVYGGHGETLFGDRVALAEQISRDSDPAISDWALGFLSESERMLARAIRQRDFYNARRATED